MESTRLQMDFGNHVRKNPEIKVVRTGLSFSHSMGVFFFFLTFKIFLFLFIYFFLWVFKFGRLSSLAPAPVSLSYSVFPFARDGAPQCQCHTACHEVLFCPWEQVDSAAGRTTSSQVRLRQPAWLFLSCVTNCCRNSISSSVKLEY